MYLEKILLIIKYVEYQPKRKRSDPIHRDGTSPRMDANNTRVVPSAHTSDNTSDKNVVRRKAES